MEGMSKRNNALDESDEEDHSPPAKRGRPAGAPKTCSVCRLKSGKGTSTRDCMATYMAGNFNLLPAKDKKVKGKGKGKAKEQVSDDQSFEDFKRTYLQEESSPMVANMRMATSVRQGAPQPFRPSDVSQDVVMGYRASQTIYG